MTDEQITTPETPTIDLLKQATEATTALKLENDRLALQLIELKNLEARRLLGGGSSAGSAPIVKKEESPREYAQRISQGRTI